MKKIIIGLIIIAVGVVLIFTTKPKNETYKADPSVEQNKNEDTSTKTNSDVDVSIKTPSLNEVKTVVYTNEGFSPSLLEIAVGEKVNFVNQSDSYMWVASGPHPAHTNLPSFDAKTRMEKGEVYSYTFTKAGTWGYHNHVQANKFGKIIVK